MNIHEYQAKQLFNDYGIPVQLGVVIDGKKEKYDLKDVKYPCVVKAQVHSGGRGKAGGVKLANDYKEAKNYIDSMLGKTLYTKQVPQGIICNKVFVVDAFDYKKEMYLSLTCDTANACLTFIATKSGGMEIEEVATNNPSALVKMPVDYYKGVDKKDAYALAEKLEISKENVGQFASLIENMYKLFMEKDCSLIEINPLVEVEGKGLLAVDAKINIDNCALFRQPEIAEMRDVSQEDAKEVEASKYDLNFVSLTGNIGCLVNGAGLAMATMDCIKSFGGEPANFLDVGGGATTEKVSAAFRILLQDKNVKAILVNIFGGIMKCDVIASGIVEATKIVNLNVPLIVRLDGTNVELGKAIIKESGLNIIAANDMQDAVKKAVNAIRGN